MFIIDQTIDDLKINERDICKVFFSINNHQIATPEMMLEDARSYIMFFHEAKHKISAYIGLHLLLTDRKLYYAHSSNPFPKEELNAVQEEALNFAEGLGAMLDELDFTKLAPGEAKRWIDKQDIFKSIQKTQRTTETKASEAVQPEPPAGQQTLEGPAAILEHLMPSQAPLQPLTQPVSVQPHKSEPSLERQVTPTQPQPMPVAPYTASLQEPVQTPEYPSRVSSVHPAPQQASPVAPKNQHLLPAQPAPSTPQYREEESEYTEPFEQAPTVRKMESQRTQSTMGAGLPGTHAKPPSRAAGPKAPSSAAPRDRQEIFQQAIRSGFVKVPKQSGKKEPRTAASVVSRDREALARLLTSF